MNSRLVTEVISLLENRRYGVTYREIAEATGIPSDWIRRLQKGYIGEPSCPRIETLYEYLKGEPLEL